MKKTLLGMLAAVFVLLSASIASAVPPSIDYQGFLQDSETGEPMTGQHTLTVRLFAEVTGGSELWAEVDTTSVDGGVFSTRLGDANPLTLSLFADPTLFLEVTVDGVTLDPRTMLVSVPFAFQAERADSTGFATNAGHASYADSAGNGGGSGDAHWAANGNDIHNTNSGGVGIGTTPHAYYRLQVRQGTDKNLGIRDANGELALEAVNDAISADVPLSYYASKHSFMGGNVGIGTTSPTDKLEVSGNITASGGRVYAQGVAEGLNKYLAFSDNKGTVLGTWRNPADPNSNFSVFNGDDGLMFTTDWADNNLFTVIGNRVGVSLGVDASLDPIFPSITLALRERNTGVNWLSSGTLGIFSNGIERIRLASNGAVGIGTSNPTAMLHVVGDLCVTGSKNRIVETPYGMTKFNAVESSEAWFTRSGRIRLVDGHARIDLPDHFLAAVTVSDKYPLDVDVTFYGPHGDWYVTTDNTGFTIYDPSGTSAEASWRVQARQRGYETWDLKTDDQAGR
jgi:hypothetical protein